MPAERPRRRRHAVEELVAAQRRHWIWTLAQTFEGIALGIDLAVDVAGLPRHADFVLDLVVVRLELVEAERPVLDRRALRNARRTVALLCFADDPEVPRIQPPALRPVVQAGAADGVLHRVNRAAQRGR